MPRLTRLIAVSLVTTLGALGCESLRGLGRADRDAALTSSGAIEPKSAERLVGYLNEQAAAVNSLHYTRVAMGIDFPGNSFNLGQSKLACEKPRNFALVGGRAVISEAVVLGSNDQEFWVYFRGLRENTHYYCSHADLPTVSSKLPVPIDPDWVMQALGLYNYPPGLDYRVETLQTEREYHLSYPQTTPGGRPVRVTVVFAADVQKDYDPQVRRMVIEDTTSNQIVASAAIKSVTRNGGPAGGVPTNIELTWPQQQGKLTLDMGEPIVNPNFDAGQRAYYFARRDMGVEPINLTRVRLSSVARAQAPATVAPLAVVPGARHVAERRRLFR